MTQQDVINEAIALIYEKTGIIFNPENVITDKPCREFRRQVVMGCYHTGFDQVFIRPNYIEKWAENYENRIARHHQYYKEQYVPEMLTGYYKTCTEDEYVVEEIEFDKVFGPHSFIIHEVGHWVQYRYFKNKPMYVPEAPRGHARLNHYENFATAFQEFVQGKLDSNSKRYKRMYRIITKELPETEYWKTHNVT